MERAPGRPFTSRFSIGWSWRTLLWQVLPVVAIGLGAFFLARGFAGGGGTTPPPATVDAQYAQRLAENIAFFEGRVVETRDSLSYNRLTSLYLERLRLTGDASDVRRAELAATRSVDASRGAPASFMSLALVRLAQHDFEATLELAGQVRALRPEMYDALAIEGDALMALGRYDEAGDRYRQYLELEPGFSAFTRQAIYAEARGQVPLATQFWEAAIDSTATESPIDSAWARVQLGNLYATNGELGEASKQLNTALQVYPGYSLAMAGQARVAAMRGDFDEAIDLYATVTTELPSPEFVAPFAEVLKAAGRDAEAARQAALMSALSALFTENGIRNDITLNLFELDNAPFTPGMLQQATVAYEARPSLAAADAYAWALHQAGRSAEARPLAEEALRLGTREPLYLFHAGMIANAQADSAAARDYLSRALEINENFHPLFAPQAKATLRQLEASK